MARGRAKRGGPAPALVWFRQDLRLADNPALHAAVRRGGAVIPIYIWAPDEEGDWAPGGASKWWLHQSLKALAADLKREGSRLILRRGPSPDALRELAGETGAGRVYWNRRYEPLARQRDTTIKEHLGPDGLDAETCNSALLHEPWTIRNKSGRPFQVFTPFWRHCLSLDAPDRPLPRPREFPAPDKWPKSLPLEDLGLEPVPDWAGGLRAAWQPGEAGAKARLQRFLRHACVDYALSRNLPGAEGTSRLSPHLRFGEISPRQVWHSCARLLAGTTPTNWRQSQFLAELGWREFSYHLLFHFPHTPERPLRQEFERFAWRSAPGGLAAWQRGETGFPIVDAGMRELWTTGWMHNRVRMIVASFLVKDLLVSWTEGARWFWDTLVDADLAQNTQGWQWTAGCGADAAPFFRVFNPAAQGEKFDPDGVYVRRWVPELAALPDTWIHQPHLAPASVLNTAGVALGKTYPRPIVSHAIAREVALEAFRRLKSKPRVPVQR
jgi:deoxyribodipyrimidine photo-lyase